MLHQNYAHYIGFPLTQVEQTMRDDFFGTVVIYTHTDTPNEDITPTRLKVFVDDQNIITKIVNG